jgi:hypothetical protein
MIGCCVIVIGLILAVPSILGLVISNRIYESAAVYNESQNMTPILVGTTVTFTPIGHMKAGNDYDIVISGSFVGPQTEILSGAIAISVTPTGVILPDTTLSASSFNETAYDSIKLEITADIVADINPTFVCQITSLIDVTSVQISVKIYENPNRSLVNFLNTLSLVFLIPALIVCCCGCCIAPPSRQRR